jgi:hypothetical protein
MTRALVLPMVGVALIAALVLGAGPSTAGKPKPPSWALHGSYSAKIDPANFVAAVDNRYFPLKPGTGYHYRGVQEDGKTRQADDVFVTHQTKEILGVKSTVVSDVVSVGGKPIERTFDWYAQDRYGNVWYMGEAASEFKNGKFVKANDSWEAGANGAQPGIIMPGNPRPGDSYRQEYYPGHAEDQARVLGSGGALTVPNGSFPQTLKTVETAPKIDPGVAEQKYYVAGLGEVKEQVVSGNREQIQLVSVTR